MDRFERRLRSELHRELDAQDVVTPPPHRARYGRLARPAARLAALRTVTLVTAIFAVGILVVVVYGGGRVMISTGPGHRLGASGVPVGTASAIPATPTPAGPPEAWKP